MAKYGIEAFTFEVVDHALLQEELNDKEMQWIAKLRSNDPEFGYNATTGGDGGRHVSDIGRRQYGVRKHTAEARARMSETRRARGATQLQRSAWERRKGKPGHRHTEEARRVLSEKAKARLTPERCAELSAAAKERNKGRIFVGRPHTEETKAKMRGRLVSMETRLKLSAANKSMSAEHKEKLMEAKRQYEMSLTPEQRSDRARRAALVGAEKSRGVPRPLEVRRKIGVAHLGKKHSPEAIEKQRQKVLGRRQTPESIAKRVESNRQVWAKKSAEEIAAHGAAISARAAIKRENEGEFAKIVRRVKRQRVLRRYEGKPTCIVRLLEVA